MDDTSQMLVRFKRLMHDLENGSPARNSFRPWEVELLLDLQECHLGGPLRRRVLRRYKRAALKSIEGGSPPLKLSDYLARLRKRRCARELRCGAAPPGADMLST